MKTSLVLNFVTSAVAEMYCPNANDLMVAYGDGVQIQDGGWGIQGDGGAATKAAFNLNGGYVEFDFDVSNANTGVIPNIYTVSPDGIGGGFSSDHYCDDGQNDKPDCLEVDWIEANGGCGGATTLHTVSGTGPGACNYWGCRTTYSFGGSTFHMKVEYGNDGKLTITRDGQQISGDSLDPPASGNDWGIVKSTYESKGGVIYSSQWTGSWVPADFCGGGPGDLDGSHFSISNLKISGSVVQGPEPQKCEGPQPSPSPSPSPTPTPSGQCNMMPGKNNDGTNLKSSADSTGSAEECCSKCSSTSGCVGFAWVHDNHECWLKSAVDSPRDDGCGGCVTSGTVNAPPTPVPSPTPHPTPTPSPSACTCGCTGDDLKACVAACPSDKFTECVQTCDSPCAPTPPTACTCGCTGDDLKACISACPDDKYAECVQTCDSPCASSCTGGDDGQSLHDCVSACPSDSFQDCVNCCTDKFPSATLV